MTVFPDLRSRRIDIKGNYEHSPGVVCLTIIQPALLSFFVR